MVFGFEIMPVVFGFEIMQGFGFEIMLGFLLRDYVQGFGCGIMLWCLGYRLAEGGGLVKGSGLIVKDLEMSHIASSVIREEPPLCHDIAFRVSVLGEGGFRFWDQALGCTVSAGGNKGDLVQGLGIKVQGDLGEGGGMECDS